MPWHGTYNLQSIRRDKNTYFHLIMYFSNPVGIYLLNERDRDEIVRSEFSNIYPVG